MTRTSEGHAAFRAWQKADQKRRSDAAIGRAVGASGTAVALWLAGKIPGEKYREQIALLLGDVRLLHETAWLTEAQRAKRLRDRAERFDRVRKHMPHLGCQAAEAVPS